MLSQAVGEVLLCWEGGPPLRSKRSPVVNAEDGSRGDAHSLTKLHLFCRVLLDYPNYLDFRIMYSPTELLVVSIDDHKDSHFQKKS